MNVSLPAALEEFVSGQIKAGEFENENAVVSEAIRLLRDAREETAMKKMAAAFASADRHSSHAAPSSSERRTINEVVKNYRRTMRSK